MNSILKTVIVFQLLVMSSSAISNSEMDDLNRNMFVSLLENDFEKFKEYLIRGASPNTAIIGSWYSSSVFCESTKPGNGKYLDYLIENTEAAKKLVVTGTYNTPVECSIRYDNLIAFEKFVSMGLEINSIVNPDVPVQSQRNLFDIAVRNKSPKITLYLIQKINPSERAISRLVLSLERFGGFEGTEKIQHFERVAQWLTDNNIEVNLKPPATDPRTIKR